MPEAKHRESQRFGRLVERADGRDFPYYNGEPIEVAGWKWGVIILVCAAGFAALLQRRSSRGDGIEVIGCGALLRASGDRS